MLLKKLSILVIFSFFLEQAKAELSGFSKLKAIEAKIIKKELKHKIPNAIIWQLEDRDFLGKALSKKEELLLDQEALTNLIYSAKRKNPELFKVYRTKSKNSRFIEELKNLALRQNDLASAYFRAKTYKEERQRELALAEVRKIKKLYYKFKALYRAKNKSVTKREEYQELQLAITKCCGIENFIQIRNLLRREIKDEVFNT